MGKKRDCKLHRFLLLLLTMWEELNLLALSCASSWGKGALTIPSPWTATESHSLFLNTLIIEGWNNLLRSEPDPGCTFDGMITHSACTASQRCFEINLIEVNSQVLGVFWRQTPPAVASHSCSEAAAAKAQWLLIVNSKSRNKSQGTLAQKSQALAAAKGET